MKKRATLRQQEERTRLLRAERSCRYSILLFLLLMCNLLWQIWRWISHHRRPLPQLDADGDKTAGTSIHDGGTQALLGEVTKIAPPAHSQPVLPQTKTPASIRDT